jgi:hypothetical protein
MSKRWNGRKMSHGRKNLPREIKQVRPSKVSQSTAKRQKKLGGTENV